MAPSQTSLKSYFVSKKRTTVPVEKPVIITKKPSRMAKMLIRESFQNEGHNLNIAETWEHGILLDASISEYKEKIRRILQWSKSHPKFDASIFMSIAEHSTFKKSLSSRERYAIDRVYYKCFVYKMY